MVMTERARGAVLQRSQSGNTIVASDLTAALDAVRNHPKDGVVWQTGDEPPSAWLLRVSGGFRRIPPESKLIRDRRNNAAGRERTAQKAAMNRSDGKRCRNVVLPAEEAIA
jgi:hypothetical protein